MGRALRVKSSAEENVIEELSVGHVAFLKGLKERCVIVGDTAMLDGKLGGLTFDDGEPRNGQMIAT